MWAEKIQNLQVRRLSGNDLEYLNLNMSLHYAKFFMILFEELFSFELSFNGEEDEEVEDLENYDLNIQYLANNNDSNFDINQFMHWIQMTFYKELIQEKRELEENNNDDINSEYINYLNEVLDLNYKNVKRIYISQICENYECDLFLNISDHLLKYRCMSYSKKMEDKVKKVDVSIIFKKYYLKEIEKPDFDIFYKEDRKYKLLRIYENDNLKLISERVEIPEYIKEKLSDDPYNKHFHGKYI